MTDTPRELRVITCVLPAAGAYDAKAEIVLGDYIDTISDRWGRVCPELELSVDKQFLVDGQTMQLVINVRDLE